MALSIRGSFLQQTPKKQIENTVIHIKEYQGSHNADLFHMWFKSSHLAPKNIIRHKMDQISVNGTCSFGHIWTSSKRGWRLCYRQTAPIQSLHDMCCCFRSRSFPKKGKSPIAPKHCSVCELFTFGAKKKKIFFSGLFCCEHNFFFVTGKGMWLQNLIAALFVSCLAKKKKFFFYFRTFCNIHKFFFFFFVTRKGLKVRIWVAQ